MESNGIDGHHPGAPPPQPLAAGLKPIAISFDNRGDRLIALGFINGVLIVLTLGLYTFWAKTDVRRRLWSYTRLNGEPLIYTGLGRELMIGFVIVFAIVGLPLMLASFLAVIVGMNNEVVELAFQSAIYLVVFYLYANASYRAQRYRMSRTEWRGIRGWLDGNPNAYAWVSFNTLTVPVIAAIAAAAAISWISGPRVGGLIVVICLLTIFWILPWRANLLRGLMTRDMRFGDVPLSYDGRSGPLYRRFALVWLAVAVIVLGTLAGVFLYLHNSGWLTAMIYDRQPPPMGVLLAIAAVVFVAMSAIGVVTASYRARLYQHFAHHTIFQNGRFAMTLSGTGIAWLTITNWMIIALALLIAVVLSAAFGGFLVMVVAPNAISPQPGSLTSVIATVVMIVVFAIAMTVARTYIQLRSNRYYVSRTQFDGGIDLDTIRQSNAERQKRGEGLAQVFDVDGF